MWLKTIIILIFNFLIVLNSLATTENKKILSNSDTLKINRSSKKPKDTTEYEIVVLDPGYENFLITQPSKEFYSELYYKSWNQRYVNEWNYRYTSHTHSGLYETYIDYDSNVEYGLDVEYRLYNFFLFFEKKTGIRLLSRGK